MWYKQTYSLSRWIKVAYRNRYQLGDFVPLFLVCKNVNGVPTVPDTVPEARLFDPFGVAAGHFSMNPVDRFGTTATFALNLGASQFFNIVGNWRIVYTYKIGTYSGMDEDTFQIVNGGSVNGNVISMYYFHRPNADYVVYQTDGGVLVGEVQSGRIFGGRGPQL